VSAASVLGRPAEAPDGADSSSAFPQVAHPGVAAGRRRSPKTAADVLVAIRRWNDLYGEPPTMADWDPYRARQLGQEWRIARFDEGDWPSAKTVRNHFGRLSAAVAAAGLVPRRQGQQRPQPELALDHATLLHLAHLEAMRENEPTQQVFAAALREVAKARASEHPLDLRVALIDLAAAALRWARAAEQPSSTSLAG
jgi:hypothetical protein